MKFAYKVGGWVKKWSKICLRNIWMVPKQNYTVTFSPSMLFYESPLFFPADHLFDKEQSQSLLDNQHMSHVLLNHSLQVHFVPKIESGIL